MFSERWWKLPTKKRGRLQLLPTISMYLELSSSSLAVDQFSFYGDANGLGHDLNAVPMSMWFYSCQISRMLSVIALSCSVKQGCWIAKAVVLAKVLQADMPSLKDAV